MVNDFVLNRVPRIVFGNGKLSALPGMVKAFGDNLSDPHWQEDLS